MTVYRIFGLIGVALAVIAAFVAIPPVALLALPICGLVVGWAAPADSHVRVIVSALALTAFAGAFNAAPAVGSYLTAIIANLGLFVAGGALMIIFKNIVNRLKS